MFAREGKETATLCPTVQSGGEAFPAQYIKCSPHSGLPCWHPRVDGGVVCTQDIYLST